MFIGLVLIAVGVIALLVNLGVLAGSIWNYTWPAVLIIAGLLFIARPFGRRSGWHGWCCSPGEEKDSKK